MEDIKPKKRSNLRIALGKFYYRGKRYLDWYFGNKKYSSNSSNEKLEHLIFTHKTPLYRKLKDVDMWLQHNKVTNLKLATEKINGVIIRPGETFSYWKLIGKPTKRK